MTDRSAMVTVPSVARPRGFDPDDALEKIMKVFWRHGYEATSLQHLCAATGLGKGSLYAAFGDKQRLYELALRRYVENVIHALRSRLLRRSSLRQAVRTLLLERVDSALASPECPGCLLVGAVVERAPHDPATARIARDGINALTEAFASVLHSARAAGQIPSEADVDGLAVFFTTMVQGLRIMSIADPDEASLVAAVETALMVIPE